STDAMVMIDSFLLSLYPGVEYMQANTLGRRNFLAGIARCKRRRSNIVKTEEALTATVEEYLETIYNMAAENEIVIGARLAEKFQVAPPTVTEMLKRLVKAGYVEMDQRRQV